MVIIKDHQRRDMLINLLVLAVLMANQVSLVMSMGSPTTDYCDPLAANFGKCVRYDPLKAEETMERVDCQTKCAKMSNSDFTTPCDPDTCGSPPGTFHCTEGNTEGSFGRGIEKECLSTAEGMIYTRYDETVFT